MELKGLPFTLKRRKHKPYVMTHPVLNPYSSSENQCWNSFGLAVRRRHLRQSQNVPWHIRSVKGPTEVWVASNYNFDKVLARLIKFKYTCVTLPVKGNVANLVHYHTKKQKSVILLSTMHRGCAVMSNTKSKPANIEFYNRNKCGVDLLDSMARMHSTKSPMRRWPMAVWCNILDPAGVNAWILFNKETGRKISRLDFMHTLALDLINPEIERRRQVERPSAGPGCNVSRKCRNCAVRKGCKNNKTMETCRKYCKAMCGRCQALICIDCADDSD